MGMRPFPMSPISNHEDWIDSQVIFIESLLTIDGRFY